MNDRPPYPKPPPPPPVRVPATADGQYVQYFVATETIDEANGIGHYGTTTDKPPLT